MYFEDLFRRLVQLIAALIRDGHLTERGLARAVGISQPHMHHVLRGARSLTPELADRLLRVLGISVLELLDEGAAHQLAQLEQAGLDWSDRLRLKLLQQATAHPDDTVEEPPDMFPGPAEPLLPS